MSQTTITVRASRDDVRKAILTLPQEVVISNAAVDDILARCAMVILGRVKQAFIVKARGGTDEAGDKWEPLKPATIKRRRGKSQSVEILRDTGLLLNSLSPGMASPNQVLVLGRGDIVLGTNRKGAAAHHHGVPKRNLPQRRLWPDPDKWPDSWREDVLDAARDGMIQVIAQTIRET